MLDSKKLIEAIDETGIKITKLAKELDVSRKAFYNKRDGITEFKASEILKVTKMLRLSRDQRDEIFFKDESESNSLNSTKRTN